MERWHRIANAARGQWAGHHRDPLFLSVVVISVASAGRLAKAFAVLLWGMAPGDAIDLNIFHLLVHRWFASVPVYSDLTFAVHPPATYVILWPFFGWLANTPARWLWALTAIAALAWLIHMIVRESGASTALERGLVALLPLSTAATAMTVRNGQLIVHLLPGLLAGLLLLRGGPIIWGRDLFASALVLFALAKPTVSLPFLWIALLLPGRLRPALLVVSGYAALTLFAAPFQEIGLFQLVRDSLARGSALAVSAGSVNLHILLGAFGLEKWILPASFLAFLGLGVWIHRHRHVDLWLLLAVTALFARFWAYHRFYDDVLLVLPEIALFRLVKRGPSSDDADVAAAALLAITSVGMLVPIRLMFWSPFLARLITYGNAVVWIVTLVFLMKQAGTTAEPSGAHTSSGDTLG